MVRRRRLLAIGWFAAVVLPAFYIALYPSMETLLEGFSDLPEAMGALLGDVDIATPEGFFAAEVFAATGPLLIAAVAISLGTGLAASEKDHSLAAVLFAPVSRWQIAASALGSIVAGVSVSCGLMFVAGFVTAKVVEVDLSAAAIGRGVIPLLAFGLFAGALAFAASAATGSPGTGTTAAWGGLLVSLVVSSAGESVVGVRWLRNVSPWDWYGGGQSVPGDLDVRGATLLVTGAIVLSILGVAWFGRRDVRF